MKRSLLFSLFLFLATQSSQAAAPWINPATIPGTPFTANATGATFTSADYVNSNVGLLRVMAWDGPNQNVVYSHNGGPTQVLPLVTNTAGLGHPVVKILTLKNRREVYLVFAANEPTKPGIYYETFVWNKATNTFIGYAAGGSVTHSTGGSTLSQRTVNIGKNDAGAYVIVADEGANSSNTIRYVGGEIDPNSGKLTIGTLGEIQYTSPTNVGILSEPSVTLYSERLGQKELDAYYSFVADGTDIIVVAARQMTTTNSQAFVLNQSSPEVIGDAPMNCGYVANPSISLNGDPFAISQWNNSPLVLVAYREDCTAGPFPGTSQVNTYFASKTIFGGLITQLNSGTQVGVASTSNLTAIANTPEFAGFVTTQFVENGAWGIYTKDALGYGLAADPFSLPGHWIAATSDNAIGEITGATDAVTCAQTDNSGIEVFYILNGIPMYKDTEMGNPKF
jgi:hypothetical protein